LKEEDPASLGHAWTSWLFAQRSSFVKLEAMLPRTPPAITLQWPQL
jgi:hypothetical protein